MERQPLRGSWLSLAGFGAGFAALGEVGLGLRVGEVAAIWPAAGVAAAAFAATPKARWPQLTLVLVAVNVFGNLQHGSTPTMSVIFAVTNMTEAAIAGSIIARILPQGRRLVRAEGVLGIAAAAVAGASCGAAIGSAVLASDGAPLVATFVGWWVADATGILVFAPAVFAAISLRAEPPDHPWKAMTVALGLAMATIYPLSTAFGTSLTFLVLVPLVAAAYRLGPRETALLLAFSTGGLMLWLSTQGGVFEFATAASEPIVVAQLFVAVLQVTVLGLAVEANRRSDLVAELRGILDAEVEAVLVVDETDTVREANLGATEMFGRPEAELVGGSIHLILAQGDVGQNAEPHHISRVVGLRRDGTTFPGEASVGFIHEPSGRGRRAVIIRDVTLQRAAEEAREHFVAAMTHELRNPLTGILGTAELLLADPDLVAHRADLEQIKTSAASLADIIDDILAMKEIDVRPAHSEVWLAAVVERAVATLRPAAVAADISIDVDLAEIAVNGDPGQLQRAIQNLMSNAIKYSPLHSRIWVTMSRSDGNAEVAVTDQGVGIPPADVERVFDRFFRAANARNGDIPGTGLGLALVRETARAHGGDASVRSELGFGTTFTITLPISDGANQGSDRSPDSQSHSLNPDMCDSEVAQ